MGNDIPKYKYKHARNAEAAAAAQWIEEPRDWFQTVLITHREEIAGKYNALTDNQKQQLKDCFGEDYADVLEVLERADLSTGDGVINGWLGESEDDEIAEIKNKVD